MRTPSRCLIELRYSSVFRDVPSFGGLSGGICQLLYRDDVHISEPAAPLSSAVPKPKRHNTIHTNNKQCRYLENSITKGSWREQWCQPNDKLANCGSDNPMCKNCAAKTGAQKLRSERAESSIARGIGHEGGRN
ncbi:hypothetical protein FQR65_LT09119 [Abscondita terminalis]|nr:hypothetical protein FQR65_LT09119 [Abscondita terminalis]